MTRFHTIATHENTDIDEFVGIWLLRKFGEDRFPGVKDAKVVFRRLASEIPDGRSAEQFERDGVLLIGIGGGRFDEHPSADNERKDGECAATLIAKELGVDDDSALKKILDYTVTNDLKGGSQPFDLAHIVKLLHRQHPDQPEKVMEWAMTALEAKYQEQLQFWTCDEEFQRVAKVEKVQVGKRIVKIVSFSSDNPQMARFARAASGGDAAVVIQRRISGHVQIFTNRRFGIKLFDVVQMIRLAEQQVKRRFVTTGWKALVVEGKVEGAEEWHFHLQAQSLLNGSFTAKDVPPTRIPLDQIREFVKIGINPDAFESIRALECRNGICTSTMWTPWGKCPWYDWGLHRCRRIRWQMSQEE